MLFSPNVARRLRYSVAYTFFSVLISIAFLVAAIHSESLLERAFKTERDANFLTRSIKDNRFVARATDAGLLLPATAEKLAAVATDSHYREFSLNGLYTCVLGIAWAVVVGVFTIEKDVLLFFRIVASWHLLLLVIFGYYLLDFPFSFLVAASLVIGGAVVGGLVWVGYHFKFISYKSSADNSYASK